MFDTNRSSEKGEKSQLKKQQKPSMQPSARCNQELKDVELPQSAAAESSHLPKPFADSPLMFPRQEIDLFNRSAERNNGEEDEEEQ
jgi:hypothetical protein